MDAVRKEAGEQGLTDKLSGLANLGGQVFQKAKDEASHSAQDEGLMPATDGNPL